MYIVFLFFLSVSSSDSRRLYTGTNALGVRCFHNGYKLKFGAFSLIYHFSETSENEMFMSLSRETASVLTHNHSKGRAN